MFSESQKKKSNQDDSDEDDDDDDDAGPSTQPAAAAQPQAGYAAPMAQLGMPPVAGAPGMHPGGYQGKEITINHHWISSTNSQLTDFEVGLHHWH